jgi:hypothetical protein
MDRKVIWADAAVTENLQPSSPKDLLAPSGPIQNINLSPSFFFQRLIYFSLTYLRNLRNLWIALSLISLS